MLHIITGLPGSGKSEAAKYLAKKLKAVVINTDELYQKLFPNESRDKLGDFTLEQLYQAYASLRPIAYYLAKSNPRGHFIMEGTFRLESQRRNIIEEMKELNYPYSVILIKASDKKVKDRILKRFKSGKSAATVKLYLEIKKAYEAPKKATVIDNSKSLKDLYGELDNYVRTQI